MRQTNRFMLAAALLGLAAAPAFAQTGTATAPAAPATGSRPAATAATPANPGGTVTPAPTAQRPAASPGTQAGSTQGRPANVVPPATTQGGTPAPRATN
jgi:hypothetical protein